jgi:hypothetical protein
MELQGRMDENGQMWLTITVRGMRGETTIEAMVDSGFTWALALPVSVAVPLGLELVDFRPAELAGWHCQTLFRIRCHCRHRRERVSHSLPRHGNRNSPHRHTVHAICRRNFDC